MALPRDYDIQECTKRQAFVTRLFLMIALFAILMTTLFATYQLYAPIMLLWLFLILAIAPTWVAKQQIDKEKEEIGV